MSEENIKIHKIKSSCRGGKKVSNIFFVIAVFCCAAALICGIVILKMGRSFDDVFQQAIENGTIEQSDKIGNADLFNLDLPTPVNLESDIPALQAAIDDHPISIYYGSICLFAAFATALVAVFMKLLSSVFDLIIKEDSPFTDKVRKKVLIVMIFTSIVLCLSAGVGFGCLSGIITWVVTTILDYGKTLQVQSDETL